MSNLTDNWAIKQAILQIQGDYGDIVSVDAKKKRLLKFGRNPDIDTTNFETIWYIGGIETYPTANTIDEFRSDSGSDTQSITIEGHTIDGSGDFTFVVQTVTLNGTSWESLTTPLARASRLYNNDSVDFNGNVQVRDNSTGDIHLSAPSGIANNQSLKCSTTISKDDYYIITQVGGGALKSSATEVEFRLKVRLKGKVFRTYFPFSSSTSGSGRAITLDPPIIIPKNSDVRIDALANNNNTPVEAFFNGYLASIVG